MTGNDCRLIEDYLPVDWRSAEAAGDPRRKGRISTLHPWRARRPLVACRVAVYSVLAGAPDSADERERQGHFLRARCQWDASKNTVRTARRRIGGDRDEPPPVFELLRGPDQIVFGRYSTC